MQPADCPNPKVYGDTQTKLLSKEKSNTILAYLVRVKAKNNQNKKLPDGMDSEFGPAKCRCIFRQREVFFI